MAGPIFHTLIAEKLLRQLPGHFDRDEFLIGNLFADIDKLGVIGRASTHFENIAPARIVSEPSSFKAGMLLHAYVDETRANFVRDVRATAGLKNTYLAQVALKLYEDMLLYPHIDKEMNYQGTFQKLLPQETEFGVDEKKVRQWHDMATIYLAGNPLVGIHTFLGELGLTPSATDEVMQMMRTLKHLGTVESYIKPLYANFSMGKVAAS